MSVAFSARTDFLREPNELSREHARLVAEGVSILDLTRSNPTQADLPYDSEGILAALADRRALVYEPEPLGPLAAREAICREWSARGFEVAPRQVALTASTSEAYAFLFKLLCDAGDEVLVPAPGYPLLEHLARFEGVRAVPYPLGFDGSWFVDREAVAARVGPRTRAVVVVSPNNPTGSFLKTDELRALEALGLPIIADEVFASYAHAPSSRAVASALEAKEALVFALSGLSKLAGLPQMKLAWTTVTGPPALVDEALGRLEHLADSQLSPSAPVLAALPELLRLRARTAEALLERLRRNLQALGSLLAGSPVHALPVEGGWYAVLRLPRTQSEEAWVLGLLREAAVRVDPGFFFDFAEPAYAVVCLLTPEARFDEGVRRIAGYVRG